MGRVFGRRPDPTPAIRRALRRRFLAPREDVVAGVYVQRPGTNSAATAVGTSAGIGSSTGVHGATFGSSGDTKWLKWTADAVKLHGVDPAVAKRTTWVTLALTESQLLLVRRSRVFRWHPREVFAAWPLAEVDKITVPRGGSTLRILRGGAELSFELPNALKFLDRVYPELPVLFEQVRAAAAKESTGEPDKRVGNEH